MTLSRNDTKHKLHSTYKTISKTGLFVTLSKKELTGNLS